MASEASKISSSASVELEQSIATLRQCLAFLSTNVKSVDIAQKECESKKEETNECADNLHPQVMAECENKTDLSSTVDKTSIKIVDYKNESQLDDVMHLIAELSEPYSVYTYRYFLHNWAELCLIAMNVNINRSVGAIVCKLDENSKKRQGYIAMLAVNESYRRMGIGSDLVKRVILKMKKMGCDEVVLETAVSNVEALRLYANFGFIRVERLFRYYLDGMDAYRLKLFFAPDPNSK